jgi:hypothetical protein
MRAALQQQSKGPASVASTRYEITANRSMKLPPRFSVPPSNTRWRYVAFAFIDYRKAKNESIPVNGPGALGGKGFLAILHAARNGTSEPRTP